MKSVTKAPPSQVKVGGHVAPKRQAVNSEAAKDMGIPVEGWNRLMQGAIVRNISSRVIPMNELRSIFPSAKEEWLQGVSVTAIPNFIGAAQRVQAAKVDAMRQAAMQRQTQEPAHNVLPKTSAGAMVVQAFDGCIGARD
jgi:hypothetical protein